MFVMESIYGEIRELNLCDDLTTTGDPKGRIEDGTHRTAAYLGEQRRHPRPLGPVSTLRPTPKNVSVEREIKCDSAQPRPIISKVLPVAGSIGESSTIAPFYHWKITIVLSNIMGGSAVFGHFVYILTWTMRHV